MIGRLLVLAGRGHVLVDTLGHDIEVAKESVLAVHEVHLDGGGHRLSFEFTKAPLRHTDQYTTDTTDTMRSLSVTRPGLEPGTSR
jgi:hypothetical protein